MGKKYYFFTTHQRVTSHYCHEKKYFFPAIYFFSRLFTFFHGNKSNTDFPTRQFAVNKSKKVYDSFCFFFVNYRPLTSLKREIICYIISRLTKGGPFVKLEIMKLYFPLKQLYFPLKQLYFPLKKILRLKSTKKNKITY